MRTSSELLVAIAASLIVLGAPAARASVSVQAGAAIYDAGNATLLYGTSAPTAVTLSAGVSSLQFSGVTGSITCTVSSAGCITINGGTLNDADGAGAATTTSYESGTSTISGITALGGGYLVGLFVAGTVPSGSAPTALDFTTGTSFTSLSPLLDQTFFIGDGLTGDGTGSAQTFYVPTGATTLYLGISDACSYNGGPGCYTDNSGSFSVSVAQQGAAPAVPEPAPLAILGVGMLGVLLARRRSQA